MREALVKAGKCLPLPIRQCIPKSIRSWSTSVYPMDIPEPVVKPELDVLLLELPQRFMPLMPTGTAYVDTILRQMSLSYQTIDYNVYLYHKFHSQRPVDDPWGALHYDEWKSRSATFDRFALQLLSLADEIARARPRILAISISETSHVAAQLVVNRVREKRPGVVVVVGGYDCVYPEVVKEVFPEFDYAVIGEAESTLPNLIASLLLGEIPCNWPGILSKHDTIPFTQASLPQDLDAVPFPKFGFTPLRLYQSRQGAKVVPIVASRGCVWGRCRFCAEVFPYRKRMPNLVADELEWWCEQGFHDFTFNESDIIGTHILGICDEIQRRHLKLTFFGQCRIQKEGTKEFYQALKAAGCVKLAFGVDGWSDKVAQLQNKGYTMDTAASNLQNCHDAGIPVAVNMVIGVPGETDGDVSDCIHNILSMKQSIDSFQNLNILQLFVGSEYWKHPEKYGIKFRDGAKQEIYSGAFDSWYSTEPFIIHCVRVERLKRIYMALLNGGVNLSPYAKWQVRRDAKI